MNAKNILKNQEKHYTELEILAQLFPADNIFDFPVKMVLQKKASCSKVDGHFFRIFPRENKNDERAVQMNDCIVREREAMCCCTILVMYESR